jgi:hypothetical protein
MPSEYRHYSVSHSEGEYSKEVVDAEYGAVTVTTNNLESMWHDRYRSFLANKQLRTEDRVLSENCVLYALCT